MHKLNTSGINNNTLNLEAINGIVRKKQIPSEYSYLKDSDGFILSDSEGAKLFVK